METAETPTRPRQLVAFRMSDAERAQLARLAETTGTTKTDVVRRALDLYELTAARARTRARS